MLSEAIKNKLKGAAPNYAFKFRIHWEKPLTFKFE